MKKITILLFYILCLASKVDAASYLYNEYSYLQEITFELYTDEVPAYKIPEQLKSIEEVLMFEVMHATWKDKHWVAFTLNKNLLGTFKVGQPALLDNDDKKKMFFVAGFPGSIGGLDLYIAEYKNGSWSKPKNLGAAVNTNKNESNPGLLNDNTLTYSSGGIIKKLDLKTFKVVDLEDATEKVEKVTEQVQNTVQVKKEEIKKEVAAPIDNNAAKIPVNSVEKRAINQSEGPTADQQILVKETARPEVKPMPKEEQMAAVAVQHLSVIALGMQSRDAMLAKYKTAIQLGAFGSPKWEIIEPLSKLGKLVTYKNDNGSNVVWITGFANRAEAESVLKQVKSIPGFENAYVTGK